MPVILRVCVSIEQASPQPPPTSILVNASSSPKSALGASSPPSAASPVPHPAGETTQPATATAAPDQSQHENQKEVAKGKGKETKAKDGKSKSKDTKTETSSTQEPHRHGHHNPILHWFKRHDKKKEQEKVSTKTNAAPPSPAASHQILEPSSAVAAADGAGRNAMANADASLTSTLHQRLSTQAPGSPTAELAQRSLTSPETTTTVTLPHADRETVLPENDGALAVRERSPLPPPFTPQRTLVWVSVQLTPATTVKMVLQQVQDMVERRMGARLCEDADYGAFSTSTTPAGSFARAPTSHGGDDGRHVHAPSHSEGSSPASPPQQQQQHKNKSGHQASSSHGAKPTGEHASPTVQVISPTSRSSTGAGLSGGLDEWCLCLQDGDGIFHWAGGTRHYAKSAVLRAPFVTEVCLQSHAAFEALRLEHKTARRAQRHAAGTSATGSSQRASFATAGGPGGLTARNSDSSSSLSDASSEAGSESTSSDLSNRDEGSERGGTANANAAGGANTSGGRSGRRRFLPTYLHGHAHRQDSPGGKAGRAEKKKSGKGAGGEEGKSGSKRGLLHSPGKLHVSDMTAKNFSKPSSSEAKFAFLKGVLVPSQVLKQRNPSLARHRRKPPLYIEVHVPREMRADPLDPSSTSAPLFTITPPPPVPPSAAAAAAVETVSEKGAAAPTAAPASPSSPGAQGSEGKMEKHKDKTDATSDANLSDTSKKKMKKLNGARVEGEVVDVDVDVDAGAIRASAPAHTGTSSYSSSASSASTLPSQSPSRQDAREKLHATQRPTFESKDTNDSNRSAAAAMEAAMRGGDTTALASGSGQPELPVGLATHATALEGPHYGTPQALTASEREAWCRSADAAHVKGVNAALLGQLTEVEDEARVSLATAQHEYATALLAYRAAVPPSPASIHQRGDTEVAEGADGGGGGGGAASAGAVDAELTALLRRKLELQATVDDARQAERQCERLTTLVECLEKELREREERRALLLVSAI